MAPVELRVFYGGRWGRLTGWGCQDCNYRRTPIWGPTHDCPVQGLRPGIVMTEQALDSEKKR